MERESRENDVVESIRNLGLTIYDNLAEHPELYLETSELETILNGSLQGLSLDYPIRTRSKKVKEAICHALGYKVPLSFKKCQPRFPGQDFDTYVQKANNLQIWNEEVSPSRRYALIRVNDESRVSRVRIVTGLDLSVLDKTGTLTHKFQAACLDKVVESTQVAATDTERITSLIGRGGKWSSLKPISEVFDCLVKLVGKSIPNPGLDQERNRGAGLHAAVCNSLGYSSWHDDGQFPDVTDQLLEVKLQTSPTIDLGLVLPSSTDHLPNFINIRHCDVRYAVFYGRITGHEVALDHVVVTPGASFFTFFRQFEGKVTNSKIQIPLPRDFFG